MDSPFGEYIFSVSSMFLSNNYGKWTSYVDLLHIPPIFVFGFKINVVKLPIYYIY